MIITPWTRSFAAEWMRETRRCFRMDQRTFAAKAGVSQALVSRIEGGKSDLTMTRMSIICVNLNIVLKAERKYE
jgi:predicted transcriptional regulator